MPSNDNQGVTINAAQLVEDAVKASDEFKDPNRRGPLKSLFAGIVRELSRHKGPIGLFIGHEPNVGGAVWGSVSLILQVICPAAPIYTANLESLAH